MIKIPRLEIVKSRVDAALISFSVTDAYLVEKRVSERAITHKLAEHLQAVFRSWHVDCEYNKHGDQVKTTRLVNDLEQMEDSAVYPDIIIHRRGEPTEPSTPPHCLVIEARKSGHTREKIARDRQKVDSYLEPPLRYRHGLLIEFLWEDERVRWELEWKHRAGQDV